MERHAHTQAAVNRLARAAGHVNVVKKMVEEGRDCSEVLIQLAAVRAELTNVGKLIFKDHLSHCVMDAAKKGEEGVLEKLNAAVDRLL